MFTTITKKVNATQLRQASSEIQVMAAAKIEQPLASKTSKPQRSFTAVLLKALSCFVA